MSNGWVLIAEERGQYLLHMHGSMLIEDSLKAAYLFSVSLRFAACFSYFQHSLVGHG